MTEKLFEVIFKIIQIIAIGFVICAVGQALQNATY
jgi:predicted permease